MPSQKSATAAAKNILLFDGDCGFCTTSVIALERLLPVFPTTLPWQWADLDELALTLDDVSKAAWLITPSRQFGGYLAFSAILRMQPGFGWRFLGHILATPPFSAASTIGYFFIAKYRHKLPGGTPACQLRPAP